MNFRFADLFDNLEKHKFSIGLDSFGLSFNTLEQVFLKLILFFKFY